MGTEDPHDEQVDDENHGGNGGTGPGRKRLGGTWWRAVLVHTAATGQFPLGKPVLSLSFWVRVELAPRP